MALRLEAVVCEGERRIGGIPRIVALSLG